MQRIFKCPKCGVDISDSYQSDDNSVGIYAGWYCDACDIGYPDNEPDYENDED